MLLYPGKRNQQDPYINHLSNNTSDGKIDSRPYPLCDTDLHRRKPDSANDYGSKKTDGHPRIEDAKYTFHEFWVILDFWPLALDSQRSKVKSQQSLIVLVQHIKVAVNGAKIAQAFPKRPVRMAVCVVVTAHLVEQFPVTQYFRIGLP